ncbi:MAG: large subunit ribosomal protein [Patescibacteria group bacterium]|nr:large subunit ribosomal protein [Patescibacteria group bacterium]
MWDLASFRHKGLYHDNDMKRGKNYQGVFEAIDAKKMYTPEEAIAFVKEHKMAKFDESVEVHMHLSINPKKSDEAVRATVILPHGTGRSLRVAVVTSTQEKEAKDAKADVVGGEDVIADIKEGKVNAGKDFDVLVATPEMMPKLALIAKILGPKGLMPSPKTETVTPKIAETVEALKKGKKASFKNDDSSNVHVSIGKLSFTAEQLAENYAVFVETVNKAKSETHKGKLIETISLCSTMGPSLKIKA